MKQYMNWPVLEEKDQFLLIENCSSHSLIDIYLTTLFKIANLHLQL